MPTKLTTNLFIEKAKKIYPKYVFSLVDYIDNKTPVKILCDIHGIFEQEPRNLLSGHCGCDKCYEIKYNKKKKLSNDEIIKMLERFSNIIIPKDFVFKTTNDYIDLECKIHGNFRIQIRSIKNSKYCCQKCANIEKTKNAVLSTRKSNFSFIEEATSIHGNTYDISKANYISCNEKIEIICDKHGSFFPTAGNFLSKGTGCPRCMHKVSKEHEKVIELLKLNNISFTVNDKSIIDNMEIDIYIDELKLGIEINGLYWHSHHDKNYHLEKLNKCESKNIHLIQIWDYEINEKWDIISSRICSYLNKNYVLFARNTVIKEVCFKESSKFINENHLQGKVNTKFNYGLYDNENLVAIMTFNKPRFSDNADFELVRYVSKIGTNVVGGANRLLKFFIKTMEPKSILSYADRRFTYVNKNLYQKLGFTQISTSSPCYVYFKNKNRFSRHMCQKHKLSKFLEQYDGEKSEYENMLDNGYRRVYDCGNLVFKLNIA